MNMTLPKYSDGIKTVVQTSFGGIDKRAGAGDGAIADMLNMTSDHYPVLTTINPSIGIEWYEEMLNDVTQKYCFYSPVLQLACEHNGLLVIVLRVINQNSSNLDLKINGVYYIAYTHKNSQLKSCLLPFSQDITPIESATKAVSFRDKLLVFGQPTTSPYFDELVAIWFVDENNLTCERVDYSKHGHATIWHNTSKTRTYVQTTAMYYDTSGAHVVNFCEGDSLYIRDCEGVEKYMTLLSVRKENEESDVVRLEFDYDSEINTTIEPTDNDSFDLATNNKEITIKLTIPHLGLITVCRDRIWGISGSSIQSCASDNYRSWYRYNNIASDSFYVRMNNVFTAITSYEGKVYFFTRENAYRLYGTTPDNFSIVELNIYGCDRASSFGIANQMLFYCSPFGTVCYDGSIARLLTKWIKDKYGVGYGYKYYLYGDNNIHVYDCLRKTWHRETHTANTSRILSVNGRLILVNRYKAEYVDGIISDATFNNQSSMVEFADISEGSLWGVCPAEFAFCAWLGEGASLKLSISYEGGEWKEIYSTDEAGKHTHRVRLTTRERVEYYRLRLDGVGEWKLYSLARSYSVNTSTPYGE